MDFIVNNKTYKVTIIRKNNKNTYIRLKSDNEIQVTTNYFVPTGKIKKLLEQNTEFILKSSQKKEKTGFYIMGKEYQVIYDESVNKIVVSDNYIVVKDENNLLKFQEEKVREIFAQRLKINYNMFDEEIPYPKLKIRKMKSRWGVCNKKTQTVTLNYNLVNYDCECLDYVIIHELAHFIHFDHSKNFWMVVEKYKPNYKLIKKILKN